MSSTLSVFFVVNFCHFIRIDNLVFEKNQLVKSRNSSLANLVVEENGR